MMTISLRTLESESRVLFVAPFVLKAHEFWGWKLLNDCDVRQVQGIDKQPATTQLIALIHDCSSYDTAGSFAIA